MENLENKIIAEKINALDYLPEGYQPNLDAKWELLQNDRKNKKVFFLYERKNRLLIAACIIFLLLCGIVLMNLNSNEKLKSSTATISPITGNKSPIENTTPKITSNVPLANSSAATKKLQHKKISPAKSLQNPTTPNTEQVALVILEADTTKKIMNENTEPIVVTKTKKQRYVQMDFDGEVQPANSAPTFAQGFQFRISLKNSGLQDESRDENSNFKLKRNF